MNEIEQKQIRNGVDVPQLARAIRFAFVIIILCLSYVNIRSSLGIDRFDLAFKDMVGHPLPPLAAFIVGARDDLLVISLLVPLCVIGALFLRDLVRSFYVIGALALVSLIESALIYHLLFTAVVQIIAALENGSTP